LSLLVTLQQALSSGYLNSVITTIEKRYEIPSSISGIIASMYEIGNVITVIFVSYLGSRRHIPVWLGMGKSHSCTCSKQLIRSKHLIDKSNGAVDRKS
jgi:organic anion transporter 3A